MRDPYDVLGVSKTATEAEIKSAFRKLAKKYHPDQSKEPKAKDRFAEVGSAYEILGDDKKRKAFDRGEIDADGKPRAPQFEGFGFGAQPGGGPRDFRNFGFDFGAGGFSNEGGSIDPDILSELFGAARGRGRGQSQANSFRMITDGTRGRPRPSGLAANPVPEPVHRSLSTPWPPTCGLTRPRPCRPSGPSGQHSSGPGGHRATRGAPRAPGPIR